MCLGDLCRIQIGRTPPRNEPRYWGLGYPWLSIADMSQGSDLVFTKESITEEAVSERNCQLVPVGTVVISFKLSVGKVGVVRREMFTNEAIAALLIRDPDRLDSRYLLHALRAVDFRGLGERAVKGVTLNSASLAQTRVPIPPLSEQLRIVAMLDNADVIRCKRQESLMLMDDLLRSSFLEMFGNVVRDSASRTLQPGWRIASVEAIAATAANSCAGGPFGSTLGKRDYVSSGVPVIRGNNLIAGRGEFRDEGFVFVTPEKAHRLRRNVALPGDVIFTQRGTLGQVAQIPLSAAYDRYIVSQSQMKVTVNSELIDPTYLVHYFLSPRAEAELALRTVATGVPHINLSILKNLTVVVPPLPLQHAFVALTAQHTTTRKRMAMARANAEMLALSLAHSVFEREPRDQA